MTQAIPRPQMRHRRATGQVLRGPWGEVVMDIADAIDNGNAPEIFVNGPCKIEKIGCGTVRTTWYSRQEDGNVVVLKVIMDLEEWLNIQDKLFEARNVIAHAPPSNNGGKRRHDAH